MIGAQAINERNGITASYEKDANIGRKWLNDILNQPKDSPQPHVLPAFGLLILNPPPINRSS